MPITVKRKNKTKQGNQESGKTSSKMEKLKYYQIKILKKTDTTRPAL